ncbi:MAG TPA: flagellar basal body P-ring formation chaperone FlgA [Rhizomicrobium sp.]|jgi:flagella basal body P-ring formation protein FlgA|nr:flagellar basal body P-ring formation chaperone FlgA [Rhizomicrobium sp.]
MIVRALIVALAVLALPLFANMALANGVADMRIVVPSHSIPRGTTISDSDLSYQNVDASSVQAGVVSSMNDLDGMETRRVLRAGEPIRPDDVRKPILVTKGSMVTINFIAPGITLTAVGKAMGEGGMGETVTVLNPISYRQISCTVTGAGTVRAGDISTTITQIASLQK